MTKIKTLTNYFKFNIFCKISVIYEYMTTSNNNNNLP